jgi:deoxyribose-phosphate aldolase
MSDCVAIGADHGGYALKESLRGWLDKNGYAAIDCGTFDGQRCDYPRIAADVARLVSTGKCTRGVIVDGAGIGSSMMANKFPGVRAALCYDMSSANNAREHNDANVLTLGAGLIGGALATQILKTFLETECREERHQRRVAMIAELAVEAVKCAACVVPEIGVAGSGGSPQNAAPYSWAPSSGGSTRDADFRKRSANYLKSRQTTTTMSNPTDNLSGDDLARVAARIAELIASGAMRGDLWCFGDVCIDARLAKPWIDAGVARLSNGLGNGPRVSDIASYIDHTLLKPDATQAQIDELCREAAEHVFASVCVNPTWVKRAAQLLTGTRVKVCTVVGFPLGASVREIKAMEARRAIREGAREIDMVINIGALKGGDDKAVFDDIRSVVDACEDGRALSKVIIETALLTDDEKVRACVSAKRARADYVKTSTGFASGGATAQDVALMARAVSETRMGVKASGGVRSLSDFDAMVRAGATRIGASAGIKIMKEAGG